MVLKILNLQNQKRRNIQKFEQFVKDLQIYIRFAQ